MFDLARGLFSPCGGVSRRGFIKVGGLGLAGLSLPELLQIRQAQAAPQHSSGRKDTAVILLWMTGGPSHVDTYDMKPHAPEQVRGPFKPIATRLPGLEVCDLLPRQSQVADKLSVIRSLHHSYGVHDDAQHLVQTGRPQPAARQQGQNHPCQGSIAAKLRGANAPQMPPYVCIPEDYQTHAGFYQTAAFLGRRYDALNAGGDPKLGNYRPPEFALPVELSMGRLTDRRKLLKHLDGLAAQAEHVAQSNHPGIVAMEDVRQQAFDLVLGSKARRAFDLSGESDAMWEQYGRHAWGHAALLSRRLVEAGATFVTINLYEKDVDWWDDHYTIEKNLRKRLPIYDQALSALIEDLHQRGMNERVLVVACGEFGRAPQIDARAGRGHWPRAGMAVLSGGGIRPGQIIGSTTDDGGEPADRPLTPSDLLATIYQVLGIDRHEFLRDRQNRPVPILAEGRPIAELF